MDSFGFLFLLAGAVTPNTPVSASEMAQQGNAPDAEVRTAIARQDLRAAGVAFDRLVERRLPAKQTNQPDPLLDELLVEQIVAQGGQPLRTIVQRLTSSSGISNRAHNLLLLATSEESRGENVEADKHYKSVPDVADVTPDQRVTALLGLSRLKIGIDPAAAVAILRSIDPATVPIRQRWEVDLQMARAISIGEPTATGAIEALLAKAWAEAPDAGVAERAVARVASDRAVAAARAGDRAKSVTLLSIDRANRSANGGHNMIVSNLPICGENGITPNDMAIVEVQRIAPPERPAINLVWASRPAIGKFFVDAARRSGRASVTDGSVAQFALRCRVAIAANYAVQINLDDVIGGWMTSKGAYPLTSADIGQNVTQLAAILADRTTHYGNTSIMRLPILLRLVACLFPQVEADEQARARVNDLVAQVTTVLASNGAPEDIKLLWHMSSIGMLLARP